MSSDEDERFSWKAASLVMLALSLLSLGVRFVLNRPFFPTLEFEISLVYVPTVVLFAARSRLGSVHDQGKLY